MMIRTAGPPLGHGYKEDEKRIKDEESWSSWFTIPDMTGLTSHHIKLLNISFDSKCWSFLERLAALVPPTQPIRSFMDGAVILLLRCFEKTRPGLLDCISCLPKWQLCAPNNTCFGLNSWHLLANTKQKSPNRTGRSNSFSLAFSPVSWQRYSVSCMDVGDFTFTSALCFDSILCVLMRSRAWCEFE